jgi:[ribosomal protein S5]-alanine N-acetyltransferase
VKVKEQFQSERLYFRPLRVADVTERYVAWMNDPVVNEFLEVKYEQQSYDSVSAFVSAAELDPDTYLYGIFDQNSGQHIGNIKFTYTKRRHKTGDLGIVIGEKLYWGKGIATESIRAMTKFVMQIVGVEQISAGCYEINRGSTRAFEKAGYRVEAIIRNNIAYGGGRVNGILLGFSSDELIERVNE